MKIVASCRLQLHGTAVWVDHMTTVVKLFQVQCHVLAVVPAAAAIPYVTCVRDSPDQTLVGLLLHPGLLLPFKMQWREEKTWRDLPQPWLIPSFACGNSISN